MKGGPNHTSALSASAQRGGQIPLARASLLAEPRVGWVGFPSLSAVAVLAQMSPCGGAVVCVLGHLAAFLTRTRLQLQQQKLLLRNKFTPSGELLTCWGAWQG